MRNTRSWKHIRKDRKQWGTAKYDKRNTPFMNDDRRENYYDDTNS